MKFFIYNNHLVIIYMSHAKNIENNIIYGQTVIKMYMDRPINEPTPPHVFIGKSFYTDIPFNTTIRLYKPTQIVKKNNNLDILIEAIEYIENKDISQLIN